MTRRSFLSTSLAAMASAATPPREFVLGLYELPKVDRPWEEAHDAGFNLVRVRPMREDFDQCHRHGLRAWTAVGSISPETRAKDEQRIRGIVEQFRNDPALLCWETEDEPAFVWKGRGPRIPPERLDATAAFIRSLDPQHPLYLNHAPVNLESTLRSYNNAADIVATDIYPVIPPGIREQYALWPDGRQGDRLNHTISQVGEYADRMRRVAGSSRAVWMVLQAFAWENLREKDRDPSKILYPTREQLRSMAYQSIIHSANGLLFWGLANTPRDAPLWGDLKSVVQDLATIKDELAAPPARFEIHQDYRENGHGVDRGVEWTARRNKNGGILLICCNADGNPLEVEFRGPDGVVSASFAPFEAKLLRLPVKPG